MPLRVICDHIFEGVTGAEYRCSVHYPDREGATVPGINGILVAIAIRVGHGLCCLEPANMLRRLSSGLLAV